MNFERCVLCGSSLTEPGMPLCSACRERIEGLKLERVFPAFCSGCGFPLLSGDLCSSCSRRRYSPLIIRSCFFYRGLVRELMIAWKFYGMRELTRYFADALMPLLGEFPDLPAVCIPGSVRNSKKRGWDQMREVSRVLAKKGVTTAELFVPQKRAREQKQLNRQQRSVNTDSRFTLDASRLTRIFPASSPIHEIILLDDIRTTGTTLRYAAGLLQMHGIQTLRAITIAMD
jgi:competence protein ComFC